MHENGNIYIPLIEGCPHIRSGFMRGSTVAVQRLVKSVGVRHTKCFIGMRT